ncbi:MAG: hypothetical protein ACK5N0_14330 [Synechococcaceae cyanobacterium]
MAFTLQPNRRNAFVGGLRHLIDVEGGATAEQQKLLQTLAQHLLGLSPSTWSQASPLPPPQLAATIPDPSDRRRFLQLACMLNLCRHPRSEAQ